MGFALKQAVFLLFFFTFSAWADQLIIEPDMGRKPIIDAINSAHHSIELVMYGFTDTELLNVLIQQKTKNRMVKVILEQSPYQADDENKTTIQNLTTAKIAWQGSIPPYHLIHQKTLIIDGREAIVMTFNFTHSTFKNERNFALVIDDPQRVNAIDAVFSADWNHKTFANTSADLILSPDDSREKILSLINQANNSIRIYAQTFNDYKIVGALAKAARKGLTVQIMTSETMRAKQKNYLAKAGVLVRISKKLFIHAKVFLIDDEKAVIGSINMTRASLDENRELSAVTIDKNVIAQLNKTFVKDWNSTRLNERDFMKLLIHDKRMRTHALSLLKKYIKEMV